MAVIIRPKQPVAMDMLEGARWDLFKAAFELGGRQIECIVVDVETEVI